MSRNNPIELARAWHWSSTAPVHQVRVSDADYPSELIACGQLVQLTVQIPRVGYRNLDNESTHAFLAFDPHSSGGRLYLVLPEDVKAVIRETFWREEGGNRALESCAHSVGGHHQGDYPDVDVQLVGVVVNVEYWTRKYGNGQGADDGAIFTHPFEHTKPWLAVDESGRLFFAGGSYDASDLRGIVG